MRDTFGTCLYYDDLSKRVPGQAATYCLVKGPSTNSLCPFELADPRSLTSHEQIFPPATHEHRVQYFTLIRKNMWRLLLLLGIPFGTSSILQHGIYQLNIEDGVLKSMALNESSTDLDLSGLGLKFIERAVFDSLSNMKSLDLSRNLLEKLPEFIFANLTSLENLSLAENKFDKFENHFVSLGNLKKLNISYNPIKHLRKSYFFGLTKFTNIITEGNSFWTLSCDVFENPFLRDVIEIENQNFGNSDEDEKRRAPINDEQNNALLDVNLQVQICKTNEGIVKTVKELKTSESLSNNCNKVEIDYPKRKLILQKLGITEFGKNWYELENFPFVSIDLSFNNISKMTPEIMNDLSRGIAYVDFSNNQFEILPKNVIENYYLKRLNFGQNSLKEIEDNAFAKTKLTELFCFSNNLKSLSFVSSLPSTITSIGFGNNSISEIPEESLSGLNKLLYLNLDGNNITELKPESFKGLSSVEILILTKNKLKTLAPNTFKSLRNLKTLYLYKNEIEEISIGSFKGLKSARDVNLGWNKLKSIKKDMFEGLPTSLRELHLDFNEIETLEAESFVKFPSRTLSLDHNKISNIPKGTFNIPYLQELHLRNNSLTTIDGDSFSGLPKLKQLFLSANKIRNIVKGAVKNLGHIHTLDLSNNPIEELRNGAFFGIPKTGGKYVDIQGAPIKLIQGGLLDDA